MSTRDEHDEAVSNVMAFLIVTLIVMALVAFANTSRDVYADQIDTAVKVCQPHNGVLIIDGNVFQGYTVVTTVRCKDGTVINATVKREK